MSQVESQSNEAAKEAAEAAVQQAREVSKQVVASVSSLDPMRMSYLGAMALVVVSTLIFNMASFSVGLDVAVSETTAQAQRVAEAKLNSWSYSAFTSTLWGKLMWMSAVAGIAILVYEATTRKAAAWIPLAQIACAALATMLLMLLFFVGFPDMSAYTDTDTSATLRGYWLPLAAAATALGCSIKRIL